VSVKLDGHAAPFFIGNALNPLVFGPELPGLNAIFPAERADPNVGFAEVFSFDKWYVPQRGIGDDADRHVARPEHVTDHEIYRMFSGKYRTRILDNTLSADGALRIHKPTKTRFTWHPFHPTKNFKFQPARWYRIKFKSL
jgi:hypothetical protein